MVQRRRFLEGTGLVFLVSLTGCTGTDGSRTDGTEPEEDRDTDETGDEPTDDESSQEADETDEADEVDETDEDGEPEEAEDDPYEEIDRGELETMTRAAVDEEIESADEPTIGNEVGTAGPEGDNGTDGEVLEPDRSEEVESEEHAADRDENEDDADDEGEEGESEEPANPNEAGADPGGTVLAQVDYDGDWMLAYSTRNRTGSFGRFESQTLEIADGVDVVSVAVQKADAGDGELAAVLLLDGNVVAEASTAEPLGIAQATHAVL